jgi:hypothetical protein
MGIGARKMSVGRHPNAMSGFKEYCLEDVSAKGGGIESKIFL